MTSFQGENISARPVEKFKPTSGMLTGYSGLLIAALGIAYIAFEVRTATGLRVALGLGLFGVVVWMTQLRSRAAAYPHTLLLKNSLVDTFVPLHLVDEVSVGSTLNVWVGQRRYVCIGIGRSMRSVLKSSRARNQPLGLSRLQEYAEGANHPSPDQSAMAYETFVATRIEELVDQTKKSPAPGTPPEVTRVLAWPELIVITLTTAAFLATLFL